MSGIAGIISSTTDFGSASTQVEAMLPALVHEPFYRTGRWLQQDVGLAAGWASHPGMPWEKGPVWNTRRDAALLFVGDDRDLPAKIATARAGGCECTTPEEAWLWHYEKKGPAFLADINGCFSGILVDLRRKTVLLFNDRFGLNRVYLHESPAGFCFASQAAALLKVRPELRRIDQRGLAEYYSVGCVLQDRSLFSGVTLLPPGSAWTFHLNGRVQRDRYFDAQSWEQQEPLGAADYAEGLIAAFRRLAPHYLSHPLPSAMSLTGGLDSRMLLSWSRAEPGALPCYSFAGPYRECADVLIARRLAAACGQRHDTLRIERDFFTHFGSLAEQTIRFSDGSMDVSGAVELYVNRKARAIAPVRLTGNYGSEILRSNVAFRPRALDLSLFTPEFAALVREAAETYRTEARVPKLSLIAFKQVPWHHHARYTIERSQVLPRAPFLDNELVALAYRAPRGMETSAQPLLSLIAAGNPALLTIPTDRAHQLGRTTLAGRFRQRWQDLTAKAEYTFDYGMPQRLARWERHVSGLHLERLFLGRHKFYHFRIWYKTALRDYLTGQLSGSESGHYRSGVSARLLSEHLSGRGNHTLDLHRLLSVRLLEQQLGRS